MHPNDQPYYGMTFDELQLHDEVTRVKRIEKIQIGKFLADTWYYSPFPPQYQNLEILYICEYCLSFYAHKVELIRHINTCPLFHPPGNEIYRD